MWWEEACGNWWCPTGYNDTNPRAFRPFLFRADFAHDVTVSNIRMLNPGFWNLVTVHSSKIRVENVEISAEWGAAAGKADPFRTPNTDGIEPMWTSDVYAGILGWWQNRFFLLHIDPLRFAFSSLRAPSLHPDLYCTALFCCCAAGM
jgi:hypothetical protein